MVKVKKYPMEILTTSEVVINAGKMI